MSAATSLALTGGRDDRSGRRHGRRGARGHRERPSRSSRTRSRTARTSPRSPSARIPTRRSGLYSPVVGNHQIHPYVDFSEAVTATGRAISDLKLEMGSAVVTAKYDDGDGTQALFFEHLVTVADFDADGVRVPENALALAPGVELRGSGGRAAWLGHDAVAFADQTVNTGIVEFGFTSTPANGTDYLAGETIEVTATFAGPLTVTGLPEGADLATRIDAHRLLRFGGSAGTGVDSLPRSRPPPPHGPDSGSRAHGVLDSG